MRDKAKQKANSAKYYTTMKGRIKWLMENIKNRGKRLNIPVTITRADLIIPERCPVLGLSLVFGTEGSTTPGSPSVDRFDPHGGYTPDNISVISHKANTIKSNASIGEMMKVCTWYRQQYEARGKPLVTVSNIRVNGEPC